MRNYINVEKVNWESLVYVHLIKTHKVHIKQIIQHYSNWSMKLYDIQQKYIYIWNTKLLSFLPVKGWPRLDVNLRDLFLSVQQKVTRWVLKLKIGLVKIGIIEGVIKNTTKVYTYTCTLISSIRRLTAGVKWVHFFSKVNAFCTCAREARACAGSTCGRGKGVFCFCTCFLFLGPVTGLILS